MESDDSPRPKIEWRAIGELGPAWITSITGLIVALTGAGFFVGHLTGGSSPTPQPTVTVTVTKTVQVAANGSPVATVPSAGGTGSATAGSGSANGTQLGSYTIDLPAGYSVPLGPTKPTQSQFITGQSGGDLYYTGLGYFPGLSSEKLVTLTSGTPPTYSACQGSTFFNSVNDDAGESFCIVESNDLVGLYVQSDQSGYAVINVNVWRYVN